FNDGNSNDIGHVRVFKNNSGIWEQIGDDINGEAENDYFGNSVSLNSDGSIVAIGTPYNDENGTSAGHVRVFKNNSGTWEQIGNDIDGEAENDSSGETVSLSSDGSVVAIGAPFNDGNGDDAGHVRVFKNNSGTWEQIGNDIDGEAGNDSSGESVSLSSDGSVIAIGAPFNNGNGDDAGHVRVFKNNSGTWEQIGDDIDGEAIGDRFGWSVSLSSDGSVVAVGASHNDGNGTNAGHVRVFKNNSGTWEQIGNDIDGEAAIDISGWSVSLSSDGSVVGVGAIWNDGNGTNAGHVRVFKNNSGTWEQIGNDIDGEAIGDHFGWSFSLSSDGSVVAIGASYNDRNGSDSGNVRVFQHDVILGIFETQHKLDTSIYPNPTNNSFLVKSEKLKIESITISDITGKEIINCKSKIVNNGFEIDLSNLESAVYIIIIQTEKGVFATKILKI
ncbi:MAG: T9SS type A sorting domain-containing protein, partial [Bacteroidota bacterium]